MFNHSIKSDYTRLGYVRSLVFFTDELVKKGVIETSTDFEALTKIPTEDLTIHLEDYIFDLEGRIHANSFGNKLYPLELFFSQNNVVLNWKRLRKMTPEKKKSGNRKAYSSEQVTEIHRLVRQTPRNRALICFMATTGVRAGFIPELKKKHLEEHKDTYLVTVYQDCKEEYKTFCTPETRKALEEYFQARTEKGEKLDGESFVFKSEGHGERNTSESMTYQAIAILLGNVSKKSALLKRGVTSGSSNDRYEIAVCHGLRKFFATAVSNSRVTSNVQALLLGHLSKNLEVSTYIDWDNKKSVENMYEEYSQCLPALAVSERQKSIYGIEEAKSLSTKTELQYAEDIEKLKEQNRSLQEQVSRSQEQLAKLLSRVTESGNLTMIDGRVIQTYTSKQKEILERD